MTKKERRIQKSLGILPIKEWMKEKGIVLHNKWWHFPLGKDTPVDNKGVVIINNLKYYKVADAYIDQAVLPAYLPVLTNEQRAERIIESVYWCISIENSSNICVNID